MNEENESLNKKVPLTISTEPGIKQWVEKKAAEDERSVSIYLTRVLRELKNKEQVTP